MSISQDNVRKLRVSSVVPGLTFNSNAAATANTTIIQNAIDALASAGTAGFILLPPGTTFANKIKRRGRVGILGMGQDVSILKAANSLNDNFIVDERWEENTLFSQDPFQMADLTIDGNNANNTLGSCYVGQTYWSTYSRVHFKDAAEHGSIISTVTKGGSNIGNSVADNSWRSCRFSGNKKSGLYGKDVANILADQRVIDSNFDNNGASGFAQMLVERAVGWVVDQSRFYNGYYYGDADLYKFSVSQILNSHFELAAKSSPNTAAICPSLRIRSWSGAGYRFGNVGNNLFWMQTPNKSATDVYSAIYFDQASECLALTGNTFKADVGIATKRAVHGATGMFGNTAGNSFLGYTTGTEYGTAWNSWARTTLGAAATDLATALVLVNNMRTMSLALGHGNA